MVVLSNTLRTLLCHRRQSDSISDSVQSMLFDFGGHDPPDQTAWPHLSQRQGELAVAQPKGSRPPPPFERWSFRKRRYVQYLRDQLEVHAVMEAAISAAVGDEEISAEDAGALSKASG